VGSSGSDLGYNASQLLDANLDAGRGDRTAVVTPDETVTYAELGRRVARAGHLLNALGVHPEQRVLLVLDDTPAFIVLFLAAMRIGAVPVNVNPLDKPENLAHYVTDTAAVTCFCEPHLEDTLRSSGMDRLFTREDLPTQVAGMPEELDPWPTHRDDAAFWLYSSGSTGLPKGVVHLHHDIRATCDTYAHHILEISEDDVCYSTTKLFHAYGLGNALSFPLSVGGTTVLVPGRATPGSALETVGRFRPTLFFSVPALYRAMLAEPPGDLGSVRLCVSAAEALPTSTAERWQARYGVEIADGIGSTEMLHIYCSNRPGATVAGTSGTPVPGYELKINEDGELFVRGDSCAAYYWRQHEKTKRSMQGEWFATGDRYRVTPEGNYAYEGRVDDMFKVGGLWISPADMEDCLMGHAAVAEAAVVGVTVDDLSRVQAFVIVAPGATAGDELADELREWCKSRLRRYEYPHIVAFVDDFPRTVTGKVQRFKLRELALAAGNVSVAD